jgi:hypothetical protein
MTSGRLSSTSATPSSNTFFTTPSIHLDYLGSPPMAIQEKDILDVAAASTGVLSLAAWLPPTASLFTIIWLGIRIYESETSQSIIKNMRAKINGYRKNKRNSD